MNKHSSLSRIAGCALVAAALCSSIAAQAAATITIVNGDPAGVGFNDPTPAAPVGGNAGTTIGQQRLNVYQAVASNWGAQLTSTQVVKVYATWEALTCTTTSAVLGSAGAWDVIRDFPGAPFADTWYSVVLANKLSGVDQTPGDPAATDIRDQLGVDIVARFNVNLGSATCLPGQPFYLGLDNNHGTLIDFYTVLLHELGHGLGFQAFTSGQTGARINDGTPHPSIWERFMLDTTTGKTWFAMTDAERVTSALNFRRLVWTGSNVTSNAASVLSAGTPGLNINSIPVPAVSGVYSVGTASFGAPLGSPGVAGQLMPITAQTGGTGPGCDPFNAVNRASARGNIALIDRGTCGFSVKVKNAQNAGAIGVVIANNAAGTPPGLGGTDATITIPTVSVSQSDGLLLKSALVYRSRNTSGVIATLRVDPTQLAGADPLGRVLLYTPNPYQSGSSVSHWDTVAFPNLLMEPAINGDLTHNVTVPSDLTLQLLRDLGWN
jgi:hypothetical protein